MNRSDFLKRASSSGAGINNLSKTAFVDLTDISNDANKQRIG